MPHTPSFDLRTEPWIPATFISDGKEHMVSLSDALINARDIRSIGGDMPIQTPAMLRLLLAVLYGLYPGGPSFDEWRELWDKGPFNDDIADYLDHKCSEIDSLINIKLSKIDSLKDYKKSIIYEYVTGKREVQ